ncbi:MAG: hypothetical protein HOW59_28885, partial [Nonomuraea sp.]|nr:hypothetical protein [Nonomuraea sp.]
EPAGGSTQPIPVVPAGEPPQPAPAFTPPPRPPAAPENEQATPPPRRPRTLLLGVGAVVALVLAVGVPSADRYLFYKSGQPDDIVHVVPRGQELAFEHVAWKSTIENMATPQTSTRTTAPDRQWLKIVITRKATDDTGTVLTAKPELRVHDKQDRTWQVEYMEDSVPPEKGEIGRPYTYTAVAVVPKAVAGEVELHLRPDTTYRSDTPTEKLFEIKPEDEEKNKKKDVLVFRR